MQDLVIEKFKHMDLVTELINTEPYQVHYQFTKKGDHFWNSYIMSLELRKEEEEPIVNPDDLPF